MNLGSIITQTLSGNVQNSIAHATGASDADVEKVIAAGVPMILGGLAKNASSNEGAKSLDNALATDHSGSLLDNINDLFAGDASSIEGSKILSHVFGSSKSTSSAKIANKTGVSVDSVSNILTYIAPIVLEQLGKEKITKGLDANDLSKILKSQSDNKGNLLMDIATAFLDKDKDGNVLDDVMDMFLSKKK